MKKYLQTVKGISNVVYSSKDKMLYYSINGNRNSITYSELQEIVSSVPVKYHFKLLS